MVNDEMAHSARKALADAEDTLRTLLLFREQLMRYPDRKDELEKTDGLIAEAREAIDKLDRAMSSAGISPLQ